MQALADDAEADETSLRLGRLRRQQFGQDALQHAERRPNELLHDGGACVGRLEQLAQIISRTCQSGAC